MVKRYLIFMVACISVGLSGCVSDLTANVYSRDEVRTAQIVNEGTVVDLTVVSIQGEQTGLGVLTGVAAGGMAAGHHIGSGSGSDAAAIGGAVLGGVLGHMIEERITSKQGVNITIRLTDGQLISVVQEVDPNMVFRVGDYVRIYSQYGTSRVVRI